MYVCSVPMVGACTLMCRCVYPACLQEWEECWVLSTILCLIALRQGFLLNQKHPSHWAGQLELSKPVCIPIPWCWGCWHVETCVTFYMDSRVLNSGSHTCHTSQPTHWTMLQSSFVFGGAVIWLWTSSMLVPHIEFISLCTPSEKDERAGIVSSSEWESYAPLIYFLY